MSNLDIYQEERPWGHFRRFTDNVSSTVKIISLKPDAELSLQSHQKRSEFWRVLAGSGFVQVGEGERPLSVGDEVEIPLGAKHQLSAGPDGLEVLEISLGEFAEEDIVRYKDKYGRI
ncbi:MAG TPA: phosphomannose isomerase type II C-terminal cupin domain [Candidatus Paceibacterota bacterium]|jgi:mannose-6-phosphate isomerase-like protein (cupin superfamily)|nr:phosphomannose isomerase type II C-terminal cupin domain [Candidatus Paceibacterota bacterium]HOH11219.1 phosphomannose isomerase type II C-terminal cupin domain [Candidatus Paceibacterota bacterium]HOY11252.1 phosphomannose isomerase type II C-terminal cupin domain [Candidatus Paceibacterota bacterium]HPB60497.1 phosphomannose isomerase type II C-terminal cupin domain [Candidatus Paceibacterota bacterium]HPI24375.1 phosphomannose isomerase type II C-terminal cupin domain [Candidatus Paceiba